jgi:Spy/CpxP family protein refolding chaperone
MRIGLKYMTSALAAGAAALTIAAAPAAMADPVAAQPAMITNSSLAGHVVEAGYGGGFHGGGFHGGGWHGYRGWGGPWPWGWYR